MIKRLSCSVFTMIIVLTAVVIFTDCTEHELYPKVGIIAELEEEKDIVVFQDANGSTWIFNGVEDWEIGDVVACIMDDMGTTEIFDDQIISVRYGWGQSFRGGIW